ncbi:hypothetical protein DFQ26_007966 [Actinomortierella ambigua]|nr:hypothetical protein DFQ26_007966 [Actinomortierella ambigua]
MTVVPSSTSTSLTFAQMSELAAAKGNTLKLKYFPFHGMVEAARFLVYTSGEKYEFVHPEAWPEDKVNTPFGVLPVLNIITESGDNLELAELAVIENFLAKRGGFLGNSVWEESIISMIVSSTSTVFDKYIVMVIRSPDSIRQELLDRWLDLTLPEWIKYHEQYLINSGNTGYYLKGSNEVSLAEIKTATLLPAMMKIAEKREYFSEEKTPALFKVLETAKKHPEYARWLASEEYKDYTAKNIALLGF